VSHMDVLQFVVVFWVPVFLSISSFSFKEQHNRSKQARSPIH